MPLLQQADEADAKVEAALAELDREVGKKTQQARETVQRETSAVVGYTIQLDKLDGEARRVVGEVAMRNFGFVRDRLRNIVLRADVGITEEAWEVREEQQTRVRNLQVERAREDRTAQRGAQRGPRRQRRRRGGREVMRSLRPRRALALVATLAIGMGVAPGALSQVPMGHPKGVPKTLRLRRWRHPKGVPQTPPPAPAASVVGCTCGAPPPAAPAPTTPVDAPTLAPVVARKQAPPPPPPSPQQLAALQELEKEADTYEKAARDYRSTITGIVQHHYEDRRRRVLSALDTEIAIEKKGLRDAREEAIRRLEAFVAKYSGANAHPENTPDAMFRLAALYEERARTDTDSSEDLAVGLKPAIALYKRIINEFPQYRELAGIYYYLGHAYNDSSRLPEAQQVWRSLVCHNQYTYPTARRPQGPGEGHRRPRCRRITTATTGRAGRRATRRRSAAAAWAAERRPRSRRAGPRPKKKGKEKEAAGNTSLDDEVTFQNPFTDTCKAIPQKTRGGRRAALPRRGVVADRRLPLQRGGPGRRAVQLQPRRGGVPAVDQVQEAAGPRRGDVQARLDVLQAAALRDQRPPVHRSAPLHRPA